ncbi:MAG TPA: Smr/MutS family protein [Candidatus Avibacteroides excrementipullorum]|nr:Smr/MutS family protein [Candidatus Avibacteroides excrementipullorum]
MIYPQNFEEKIGFDNIRALLKGKCLSDLGRERVAGMSFATSLHVIENEIDMTVELMSIMSSEADFPVNHFYDMRQSLKKIRIEGTWMSEQEIFDLRRSLQTVADIASFFGGEDDGERYPALKRLAADVVLFPDVVKRIDAIIDKFGKVKDNASARLREIRMELSSVMSGISKNLYGIIRAAQNDGYVDKDVVPTMRDGRLVIPVAPALKRRIKGIVHDESASGKTVFIEPAEIVEANNRIRELESEEKREIIRILTDFADYLRPQADAMMISYDFLGEIDFIRAKALFSIQVGAVKPDMSSSQIVDWSNAVHPLLKLSLEKHGKKVVPLDIRLNGRQRILLISGPNAGGKSVCLKTVGLLQYMYQCGMPVCMDESSVVGLFDDIFIDIGDEQSIENDLSTYSSHLLNMKIMLKKCNAKSLLLIDEFGSGTEPQIGGAIAEALLQRFNAAGACGVITTHYQNLKHFADSHEGVVNGAMLYDRQKMQALFQLQIGNPGSSFAVEIARKIGLPEDVIKDASDMVGSDYINSDKYLQDIVRDKRYWENKRQNIRQKEKALESTIAAYEKAFEELKSERKDILLKAKDEALKLISDSNAAIENTIREIKEAQAEKEKTKELRKELTELKAAIENENNDEEERIKAKMERLREKQQRRKKEKAKPDAAKIADRPKEIELKAGDFVRVKGQSSVGQIMEISGTNVKAAFGAMVMTLKKDRIEPAAAPKKADSRVSAVSLQTQDHIYEKKLAFKQDIDVRGMRGDEAVQAVTYFIDDAIQVGMDRVRILHGTGNGILRTLIRQYLETVPGVKNYRDEHVQFGGAGITVVDLY